MRPASMTSNGGANTFAPSDSAFFADSSTLATVTYEFQCGGAPLCRSPRAASCTPAPTGFPRI